MFLSPTTHNLIKAKDLALMKPISFFVNSSRGPIVQDFASINVKKIAALALYVFDVKPLPQNQRIAQIGCLLVAAGTDCGECPKFSGGRLMYLDMIEDQLALD